MNNYIDSVKHKGKFYKYKDWDLIHPDEENVGKVLSVTLDSEGNPVTTWTDGGNVDMEYLSKLFEKYTKNIYKQVGTTVPNTGTVSTLYVPKDFSYEKCLEYFDRLTFTNTPDGDHYPIITSVDNEPVLSFVILGGAKFIIIWGEIAYQTNIEGTYGAPTEFGLQFLTFIQPDGRVDFPAEIQLSDRFTATSNPSDGPVYTEMASGAQNDLITDLISIAPYENVVVNSETFDCAKYSIRDKEGNDITETYAKKEEVDPYLLVSLEALKDGIIINKDTFDSLANGKIKKIKIEEFYETDNTSSGGRYIYEYKSYLKLPIEEVNIEVALFETTDIPLALISYAGYFKKHIIVTHYNAPSENIDMYIIVDGGSVELLSPDILKIFRSTDTGNEEVASLKSTSDGQMFLLPNAKSDLSVDNAFPTAKQVKDYVQSSTSLVYDIDFNDITTDGLSVGDDVHEKIINGQITTIRLRKTVTDNGAFDGVFDFELKRSTDLVENTSGTSTPSRYITFTGLNDSLVQYITGGYVSLVTIIYDKDNKKFIIHPLFSYGGDTDAEIQMLTSALRAKGNNNGDVIGNVTLNDGIVLSLNVDITEDLSNDSYLVDSKAVKTFVNKSLETYASTAYVEESVANLVDSAPETMNTIGELATALKENQDVVETINNAITNKANRSELSPVATTGSYNDLVDTPDFTTVEQVEELIANSGSSGSGGSITIGELQTAKQFSNGNGFIDSTDFLRYHNGITCYIEEWEDGKMVGTSPYSIGYAYYGYKQGEGYGVHFETISELVYPKISGTTMNWYPVMGTPNVSEMVVSNGNNYFYNNYFDITSNKVYATFGSGVSDQSIYLRDITVLNEFLGDTVDPAVYKGEGAYLVIRAQSSPILKNKIISDKDGDYKLIHVSEYYAILSALSKFANTEPTLKNYVDQSLADLSIVEANPAVTDSSPTLLSMSINDTAYKIGVSENDVNALIEAYITANFENGDEGSY